MSGPLLSHDALEELLRAPDPSIATFAAGRAHGQLRGWHARLRERLGPATGARTVFDLVAEPLMHSLGYDVSVVRSTSETVSAALSVGGVGAAAWFAPPGPSRCGRCGGKRCGGD